MLFQKVFANLLAMISSKPQPVSAPLPGPSAVKIPTDPLPPVPRVYLYRSVRSTVTYGILAKDLIPICLTLELPWINNKPEVSCVPAGVYRCLPHNSAAHPGTWELQNVPNRSDILIHTGNFAKDSKGCILVGQIFGATQPAILQSQAALVMLRNMLPPVFDLQIVD